MINLNHTPHPLIEDHYHIRELIEAQEKRSNDRTYHRERVRIQEERLEDIKDYKAKTVMDFWCDKCKKEFKSETIKQIEIDWNNPMQIIAFYKTKCWKKHWCIRLITDRHKDGYFKKSIILAKDKEKYFRDIIQPHETGFNMLYGKSL